MKHAGQVIKDNDLKIMRVWEKEVQKKVIASRYTNEIVLLNHLPNVLHSLADLMLEHKTLEEAQGDEQYQKFLANSADHGRHRAASTHYTVDQIIHEYIIFHQILTELLIKENVYKQNTIDLLKYGIETAMLKSAEAFSLSIQEMQEKLVGTLAHDIRNPLTTVQLALQLMAEEKDKEELIKLKDMALRAIAKSLRLTEGLLDTVTVKAGEGIMLSFSEDEIVHHAQWVHREATELYTQDVRLICNRDEINGIFDGTAIRRVLENLITNAVKYGAADEPITIKVEDQDDYVKLTVHNYGNPIPEERQNNIFKFLNRDKESSPTKLQSWGIGLTLVKIVAEAHNGTVELQSSKEHGTSFSVILHKSANKPGKVRTRLNYTENGGMPYRGL